MSGNSEDIQTLLAGIEKLVAYEYADAAVDRFVEVQGQPSEVRMKTSEDVAKAGRAVKLFLKSATYLGKAFKELRGGAAGASNDKPETTMNDDAKRWTPERIAELHAKVRERLAAVEGTREFKQLAERDHRERTRPGKPAGAESGAAAADQGGSPAPAG